jgi:hypothetical protein
MALGSGGIWIVFILLSLHPRLSVLIWHHALTLPIEGCDRCDLHALLLAISGGLGSCEPLPQDAIFLPNNVKLYLIMLFEVLDLILEALDLHLLKALLLLIFLLHIFIDGFNFSSQTLVVALHNL